MEGAEGDIEFLENGSAEYSDPPSYTSQAADGRVSVHQGGLPFSSRPLEPGEYEAQMNAYYDDPRYYVPDASRSHSQQLPYPDPYHFQQNAYAYSYPAGSTAADMQQIYSTTGYPLADPPFETDPNYVYYQAEDNGQVSWFMEPKNRGHVIGPFGYGQKTSSPSPQQDMSYYSTPRRNGAGPFVAGLLKSANAEMDLDEEEEAFWAEAAQLPEEPQHSLRRRQTTADDRHSAKSTRHHAHSTPSNEVGQNGFVQDLLEQNADLARRVASMERKASRRRSSSRGHRSRDHRDGDKGRSHREEQNMSFDMPGLEKPLAHNLDRFRHISGGSREKAKGGSDFPPGYDSPSSRIQPRGRPADNVQREEVVTNTMSKNGISLKPVTAIPDMYRSLFKFPVFNAVQSLCFQTVYETPNNVVISAPTGAGKTVMFEIAMIRVLRLHKEGQIVYLAPTKSLCTERVKDWKAKFSTLSIKCCEFTGDSNEWALKEAKASKIIVTTPEKWDVTTRRSRGATEEWYNNVKLLCIDEVHLLAESRGATLEVIVSRMKKISKNVRFVAVSATVPNIEDIGIWLGSGQGTGEKDSARVFKFGDEFRPCPLQKIVYSYPQKESDFKFDNSLNYRLLELIQKHASGKPVLVFCNTRKGCGAAAEQLMRDYKEAAAKSKHTPAWPIPLRSAITFEDSKQQALAEVGIGVHHAGLSVNDKHMTESMYLAGKLRVICTTSTLAVGVNLPARMVIIKGTTIWDAATSTNIKYTDLDIMQMMGRAGRPQFDTTGVALILCRHDERDRYERMANCETVLESCLHNALTEHINSEVATRTIRNLDQAFAWLRGTFLYVRIKKNPQYYRNIVGDQEDEGQLYDATCTEGFTGDVVKPEERLEEMAADAVKSLMNEGLVDEDEEGLVVTPYGNMLSFHAVRFETFIHLKNMEKGASMRILLKYLAEASEYGDVRFRSGEKTFFDGVNKRVEIKYPLDSVTEPTDKVNLLVQLTLSTVSLSEFNKVANSNIWAEANAVMQHASRIASCLANLAVERKDAKMAMNALLLKRCIAARTWDHCAGVLTQIEDVGAKIAQILGDSGIRTFAELRKMKPHVIELRVGRQSGFGAKLIKRASMMPDFNVKARIRSEVVRDTGVHAALEVSISLKNKFGSGGAGVQLGGKMRSQGPPMVEVLMMTSDFVWIGHGTLRLHKIAKEGNPTQSIAAVAVLTKPSQKIRVHVACSEMVGLDVTTEVALNTPASEYPLPQFDAGEEDLLEGIDFDDDEDITREALSPVAAPQGHPAKKIAGKKATQKKNTAQKVKEKAATIPPTMPPTALPAALKLPNGKYQCNHPCTGGDMCKHVCCRDGLDKPPRPKKTMKAAMTLQPDISSDTGMQDETVNGQGNRSSTENRAPLPNTSFGADTSEDGLEDDLPDITDLPPPAPKKPSTTKTRPRPAVTAIAKRTNMRVEHESDLESGEDMEAPNLTSSEKRKKHGNIEHDTLPDSKRNKIAAAGVSATKASPLSSPPQRHTSFEPDATMDASSLDFDLPPPLPLLNKGSENTDEDGFSRRASVSESRSTSINPPEVFASVPYRSKEPLFKPPSDSKSDNEAVADGSPPYKCEGNTASLLAWMGDQISVIDE